MGDKVVNIIPDVLEVDVSDIAQKVELVKESFERFHVDIIDGLFVDNLTVSLGDLKGIDFGELKLDLHLMVDDPVAWVEECVELKPGRVIGQIERMGSQREFVDWVKGYEVGVGLAVDLYTPVSSIEMEVLSDVDVVLLMSVKAGNSGQKFEKTVIKKIEKLREGYDGLIMVDGGMNDKTYEKVIEAGADEVAMNSYLWKHGVKKIKEIK